MMRWITMAAFMAAAVLVAAYQSNTGNHLLIKAIAAGAVTFALCALSSLWGLHGFALLLLLLPGQAGCLLWDAFYYGRKIVPVQVSLYLSMDTALLPLLACREDV